MSKTIIQDDLVIGHEISKSFDACELALSIAEMVKIKHLIHPHHPLVQHIRFYMEEAVSELCEYYGRYRQQVLLPTGQFQDRTVINCQNSNRIDELLMVLIEGELNSIILYLTQDASKGILIPKRYHDLARCTSKQAAILAYLIDFNDRVESMIHDTA